MTVTPRNVPLNQTAVLGSKKPEATVQSVGPRRKVDPDTRQYTDEVIGYNVNVYSARGEVQTVKVPLEYSDTIKKMQEALDSEQVVKVKFTQFRGKFYAMLDSNNSLKQGITVTASSVEIVSIEAPEFDDLDEIDL